MTIGQRIRSIRGDESRRAFAERIGIVENTLRNYEQGLSLPNSDVIAEIHMKTGCSLEWLLLGKEEKPLVSDVSGQTQEEADASGRGALLERNRMLEADNTRLREQVWDLRRAHEALFFAVKGLLKNEDSICKE